MKSAVIVGVLLIAFHGLFTLSQTTTGKASSSGTCAVSHSGNNDVINIRNCGIGKQEADKIVAMLSAILANQKEDTRDAKLDELLELAKRTANPYGTVTTYDPDGAKRMVTQSTGTLVIDSVTLVRIFQEMMNKQQARDWNGVLELVQKAKLSDPGWFTVDALQGLAQANLCKREEARTSLTKFIGETEAAPAFADLRQQAQRILAILDTKEYEKETGCKLIGPTQ